MTHEDQSTHFEEIFQLLSEHGFEGMAEAIEVLMNEAMKLERAEVLGATPYQRTETRRGYASESSQSEETFLSRRKRRNPLSST